MTWRLGLSLLLAFASTTCLNWAFYRQHGQASTMPRLSLRSPLRSLALLFSNLRWLGGFVVGLLGWGLYVVALAFGPLSLVQAVSAGGIGILALLVWRWGGVSLTRREWIGVGVSIGGLLVLGLSLVGSGAQSEGHGAWPAVAGWIAASGVLAAAFVGPAGRTVVAGAGFGIGAGLLYAAADVATKAAVAGGWWVLFVPAVLLASVFAFALLQLGFQRGNALATAGVSSLFTNALPIIAGTALFHERLPAGLQGAGRVLAFAAVIGGALLLARPEGDAQRRRLREPASPCKTEDPLPGEGCRR